MIVPESYTFDHEDGLLRFLVKQISECKTKTSIMAGHYMLMYDNEQNCLVPMVWQDTENSLVESVSRKMAGSFPLRSFRYGLDLWQKGQDLDSHVQIALLINDHQFQSSYFREINYDQPKGRGGELRKEYYRRSNNLPQAFVQLLRKRGLDKSEILLSNNNMDRDASYDEDDASILPPESVFFSEQHLRRRFDRHTRQELSEDPRFKITRLDEGGYDLFYYPAGSTQEFCLTEQSDSIDGITQSGCGCSGEVIEFLIELSNRGFGNIILFVPHECAGAVNVGVQAAVDVISRYYNLNIKVTTVTGVGGMGSFNIRGKLESLQVKYFFID